MSRTVRSHPRFSDEFTPTSSPDEFTPLLHVPPVKPTTKDTMSVKVRIPSPLRSYTNGADVVEVPGGTIREALSSLKDQAGGIETRLFKGPNQLNRFVNVYLNDEDIRFLNNLDTPTKPGDEISIVPAIAGGAE